MTRAKFLYLIFVVHLKIPFQIIPDLVSEDQDTVRGCDFLRGALPMIRDPPRKAKAKGHVSGGVPDTPAPEGSVQLRRPGCRLRCWVLAQSGVVRGRRSYLWPRGWAGNAGPRNSRLRPVLPRLSPARDPRLPRWRPPGGDPRPRNRRGRSRTAANLSEPTSREVSGAAPPPRPRPPSSGAGSSRDGCAAEASAAAASASASALASPSLPWAVRAACGHSSGLSRPALLSGGGGGGCGWGGLEAAAALGGAEHSGRGRRGSGRPGVLPAVWGPQGRLRAGAGPLAPFQERGRRAGGTAPRPGAASHPGRRCQGDGMCVSTCARPAGPQVTLGVRTARCYTWALGGTVWQPCRARVRPDVGGCRSVTLRLQIGTSCERVRNLIGQAAPGLFTQVLGRRTWCITSGS